MTEKQNMRRSQTRGALSAMMFMVRILINSCLIQPAKYAANATILKNRSSSRLIPGISRKGLHVCPAIRLILLPITNCFENPSIHPLARASAVLAITGRNRHSLWCQRKVGPRFAMVVMKKARKISVKSISMRRREKANACRATALMPRTTLTRRFFKKASCVILATRIHSRCLKKLMYTNLSRKIIAQPVMIPMHQITTAD